MTSEPLDDAARKARHKPIDAAEYGEVCDWCNELWPCDASTLTAEVDRLAADLAAERAKVQRVEDLCDKYAVLWPSMIRAALAGEDRSCYRCGNDVGTDSDADRCSSYTAALTGEPATACCDEHSGKCCSAYYCCHRCIERAGEPAAERSERDPFANLGAWLHTGRHWCNYLDDSGREARIFGEDEACPTLVRAGERLLASESAAEVTLHANRTLPPDLAQALADLARATVESTQPPSYAVIVCAQGIIGCRSVGQHQEHDLAERPFVRAEDSSGDSQTVTFGEPAAEQPKWADLFGMAPDFDAEQFGIEPTAEQPCASPTCPDHAGRWMHEPAAEQAYPKPGFRLVKGDNEWVEVPVQPTDAEIAAGQETHDALGPARERRHIWDAARERGDW